MLENRQKVDQAGSGLADTVKHFWSFILNRNPLQNVKQGSDIVIFVF